MLVLFLLQYLAFVNEDTANSTDVSYNESESLFEFSPAEESPTESEEVSEPTDFESIDEFSSETSEVESFDDFTSETSEIESFDDFTSEETEIESIEDLTSEFSEELPTETQEESEPETESETPEPETETPEPETETPEPETETPEPETETPEPETETPEPETETPEPPVPTFKPEYNSDELCVCTGDFCKRCDDDAQKLTFSQLSDFISRAREDELEITLLGSTADNRVPFTASSASTNSRLEELQFQATEDDDHPSADRGYVEFAFDISFSLNKNLKFRDTDVKLVIPKSSKLLANNQVGIDRLSLSNSPLHGEVTNVVSKTVKSDLVSVAGMTMQIEKEFELDAPTANKITIGASEIVVGDGSQTTTIVNNGNSGKVEIESKSTSITVDVPEGTTQIHTGVVLNLDQKTTLNVTGWADVSNPGALTIDSGKNSVDVVTDDKEVAKQFTYKGSGQVTVNGEVVKKGGMSTGAIIAISVVCIVLVGAICIVIAVCVVKKRKNKQFEYRYQVDEPINLDLEPI